MTGVERIPPRVLLIMGDQWARALVRAALREVGYDAVGARDIVEAHRYRGMEPGRGPIKSIVVDHDAAAKEHEALNDIVDSHRGPSVILLAHGTREPPPGSWSHVVRRPLSVADVVAAVQAAVPLPEDARRPLDVSDR